MDRRAFLAGCAGLATGLGACASLASVAVPVRDGRMRIRIGDHPGLAGPEGLLRIRPDGSGEALFLLATPGGWVALSPVCTHRGCIVDAQGDRLVCPCHGSTYERSGAVVEGPAERPLSRFPVSTPEPGVIEVGGLGGGVG